MNLNFSLGFMVPLIIRVNSEAMRLFLLFSRYYVVLAAFPPTCVALLCRFGAGLPRLEPRGDIININEISTR